MRIDPGSWSDEHLAGQRLMAGFQGTACDAALEGMIGGLHLGGLILFRRNVESPAQLTRLCASAQAHARACGLPPLLIAVDQEGGQVSRLGPPFTQFPGNPALQDESAADRFAAVTAAELGPVGINMNLAPVLDVVPEGLAGVMAARVFTGGPRRVARMGCAVIEGLQRRGIMAVAKHFPGIGRTILDSHVDRPILDETPDALEAFDLIPFREAAAHAVAGVMLSHILYPRLDPQWPASLSRTIVGDLLRRRMGYEGIVMTDDLEMGAIERRYGFDQTIERVVEAGLDLALICHTREKIGRAFTLLARASGDSEENRRRAERSVGRILAAKQRYLWRE
jgi:beta-N-acetylhexosaminidase